MKEIDYKNYYWRNELVRLRPLRIDDWEEQYYNKFDSYARRLLKFEIELPPSIDLEKKNTELFTNFNRHEGRTMFGVENLKGDFVGSINLFNIDDKNGTFTIGVIIGTEYRGNGFGTAAMRILLRFAFCERRLNKFHSTVLEENIASITMLRKIGCIEEGKVSQMVYTDGKYLDLILLGLTKDVFVKNENCERQSSD